MQHRKHQRGAALIIGLMMLVIITLLAVTAVSTSTTELVMAGNEQFRERAFQAAESGVETSWRKVRSGDADVPFDFGTYLDDNNVAMTDPTDTVSTRIEPYGANELIGGSSKFVGQTFRLTSTGRSSRNSQSVHEAGVWVLSPFDEVTKARLVGTAGNTGLAYGAL